MRLLPVSRPGGFACMDLADVSFGLYLLLLFYYGFFPFMRLLVDIEFLQWGE